MRYTVRATILFRSFSALQRAEIAEIPREKLVFEVGRVGFSALQRAEIAEMGNRLRATARNSDRFSALQRAEIAEILRSKSRSTIQLGVSVLFNEPKLLKSRYAVRARLRGVEFQCSSTSRNC